ncbi:MAG: MATE family efflux transporter [Anaerolineaceae bacterium]|nr:MATE family efflux transporter [Anaerolineaceae bacterium]
MDYKMTAEERKKFYKELTALAFPIALQRLLTALVGASDALMLGRLTQEAIAAVSLANQVSFVMSLFTGSVIGAISILAAQYWGKKDTANVKRFLGMAIRYAFGISLVFFLPAFFVPEKIMAFFTADEALIRIGSGYLRIVSFSYLFTGIAECFLMLMKITGFAKISVWISAVTVIIDMTVDLFLIYGLGPFPALGANGSAWSTIAVEAIALIWCLIWSRRKKDVRIGQRDLLFFSKTFEKDIWKVIPGMLASNLSWGLSLTMHSFILGHLGTDATAAHSVTNVAKQLVQCLSQGLAAGTGIMIGQLLGQNKLEEAKKYGEECWRVAFFNGLINIALIGIVGPLVYLFYVLEPLSKTYLVQMLIFNAFYMFALSYNAMFTVGVFPAGGDTKYDAVTVILATWCFSIPLALLGLYVFHWPVMLIYCVMCIDEIIKFPLIRPYYKRYIWVKNLTRVNN